MIQLANVNVRAGAFHLEGVSLTVPTGRYGILMGRTGSGKTTLLEAIAGLKRVRAGSIVLDGQDVTCWKPAARCLGYVPQDLALFPTMTVREHLMFALVARRAGREEIRRRVEEMSVLLGVGALLDRYPAGLSGGEAQRVALGRALSFHPRVLLLDEPLSALDEDTRQDMYDLLRQVQRQTGVTVLHVTHNPREAQDLGDLVLHLRAGRIDNGAQAILP